MLCELSIVELRLFQFELSKKYISDFGMQMELQKHSDRLGRFKITASDKANLTQQQTLDRQCQR